MTSLLSPGNKRLEKEKRISLESNRERTTRRRRIESQSFNIEFPLRLLRPRCTSPVRFWTLIATFYPQRPLFFCPLSIFKDRIDGLEHTQKKEKQSGHSTSIPSTIEGASTNTRHKIYFQRFFSRSHFVPLLQRRAILNYYDPLCHSLPVSASLGLLARSIFQNETCAILHFK